MRRFNRRLLVVWVLALGISGGVGQGADWPTYRADAARSGYTPESLADGLTLGWTHRSAHAPMPAWPGSDRMQFDRAYQPVVAGENLYYGSSADGKVVALDAVTGAVRWTHFTDAPVRFAPVVSEGRVFVAGDDGWLICLAAADGKVLWRLRGGPRDDMLLGNDRVISRWPARGGPVLADGVLYFAAGIWPSEGIYVYAVDPATGKVRWCNDSSGAIDMPQPHPGANARSGVAAQGYLAVRGPELLVSTGRAVPAVFDRQRGSFQSFPLQAYGQLGGADVVVFDDQTFNHGTLFSRVQAVKPQALGPQVALHPQWVVSCVKDKLRVHDRANLWIDGTATDRKGNRIATKVLAPPAWTVQLPHPAEAALIVAGQKAVAGGAGQVSVVDLAVRKVVWTGVVEGTAYGLAAAEGRLFVSADRGNLYCFQDAAIPAAQPKRPAVARPSDDGGNAYSKAAEEILRRTGVRDGYCLDLGCGDGRLAIELARQSKLHIYAVDDDAANVAAARQRLDTEGLYGTRVTVHRADPRKVPYPRWFADLIVSGRSVAGEPGEVTAAAARCLRPCGGAACLGQPGSMIVSIRAPLAGAGDWTHQYADAANSLCSSDTRLRGPLGMLWFRDTDLNMPNRHGRGPAPLVAEGRMFVEGADALRAVSIYNGRTLWEYPLPGILRTYHQDHLMGSAGTGSNYCLAGDRIYLAAGDRCFVLSAADGRKVSEWRAPPQPDGKAGTWGLIAGDGRTLLGSLVDRRHLVKYRYLNSDMSQQFTESLLLFALDMPNGQVKWTFQPRDSIRHNAVALGDGRVYLIDRPVAAVDKPLLPAAKDAKPDAPPAHQPGRLLALDLGTGETLWQTDKDVFGTMLAFGAKHGVLLMSYQPSYFRLDSEVGGRMAGLRAGDGAPLWDTAAKYTSRPILNDRTIYAEPGAWDLLTGRSLPFRLSRSYGCGIPAGARHLLVFRSATLGYVDLSGAALTENYGGIRPGCWVNAVPAGGLVLMADAASHCKCSYLNQATVALCPQDP